ncbi:predicted protein [Scheffersomyces stipitis CBS 6054]|uniref:Chromosome transmission fidelity protein 8 n=1 Tax=Scheffersomyces stipitis (strain ATCC 58785 / CBS 6054 / NBRC 10063 / NRRL Y-11545) TaxID=322104 RepID=A3LX07_PICST|nr:predicted protein [Scheffersomyces stipitis CBS 6054]ABN67722.2 predicted protein [Scheffersomyces stipitis CBS 6054]KAG2732320.1 hypothetical protein G9P44_004737 [Scheffersomyces stipitis]
MPSAIVDLSGVRSIANSERSSVNTPDDVISTPFGLSLIEIQGELNLPHEAPINVQKNDTNAEYIRNFVTVDEIKHAVNFGQLQLDEKDPSKVTLFIGKSQRLLGSIVELDLPLGVMKIPLNQDTSPENGNEKQKEDIQIVDIVRKKMIFKQRPLPIMQ